MKLKVLIKEYLTGHLKCFRFQIKKTRLLKFKVKILNFIPISKHHRILQLNLTAAVSLDDPPNASCINLTRLGFLLVNFQF